MENSMKKIVLLLVITTAFATSTNVMKVMATEVSGNEATCEHIYTSEITTGATCTSDGVKTFTCSKCEDTYTETVSATGHTEVKDVAVAATCANTGKTEGSHCGVCGETIVAQEVVAATEHSYKTVRKKATTSKDGSVTKKCIGCGMTVPSGTYTIYRPKTVKLSKKTVTYTGKKITPSVTVKDSKGKKIKKKYYTVKYKKNENAGIAEVTVKFKGNLYRGKLTKKFTIKPMATSITTVMASGFNSYVKWDRVTKPSSSEWIVLSSDLLSGYQLQYATDSGFKGAKSVWLKYDVGDKTLTGLSEGTKYYLRIRTYKNVKINGKSKKIYSAWSETREVTMDKIIWEGQYPLYTVIDNGGWDVYYYSYNPYENPELCKAYGDKGAACMEQIEDIIHDRYIGSWAVSYTCRYAKYSDTYIDKHYASKELKLENGPL